MKEQPKIFLEFLYLTFQKNYHTWIQQFYFGGKQKYISCPFDGIKTLLPREGD
jgi:hypothetical protein